MYSIFLSEKKYSINNYNYVWIKPCLKRENSKYLKFLGLTIDNQLNWNEHVNNCVLSKVYSSLLYICFKKNGKTRNIKTNLLCFCSVTYFVRFVFGETFAYNLTQILVLQKKAIKKRFKTRLLGLGHGLFPLVGIYYSLWSTHTSINSLLNVKNNLDHLSKIRNQIKTQLKHKK